MDMPLLNPNTNNRRAVAVLLEVAEVAIKAVAVISTPHTIPNNQMEDIFQDHRNLKALPRTKARQTVTMVLMARILVRI
jgi:hypothetical protein